MAALYAPQATLPSQINPVSHYAPANALRLLATVESISTIVGGRMIPLPPGEWHSIGREQHNGDPQVDVQLLAKTRDGRVVAVVVAFVVPSPTASVSKLPFGKACEGSRTIEARVVPDTGDARECWGIVAPMKPEQDWSRPRTEVIYTGSLDSLRDAGVALPTVMVGAVWNHVDAMNWAIVQYFFDPDLHAPALAWNKASVETDSSAAKFVTRLGAWAERTTPLLQQGLRGTLKREAITAATRPDDPS